MNSYSKIFCIKGIISATTKYIINCELVIEYEWNGKHQLQPYNLLHLNKVYRKIMGGNGWWLYIKYLAIMVAFLKFTISWGSLFTILLFTSVPHMNLFHEKQNMEPKEKITERIKLNPYNFINATLNPLNCPYHLTKVWWSRACARSTSSHSSTKLLFQRVSASKPLCKQSSHSELIACGIKL